MSVLIPSLQSVSTEKKFAAVNRDYTSLFPVSSGTQPLLRAYANLTGANAVDYFLDTVQFPLDDKSFDACRSFTFSFRPLYYNGSDYPASAPANLFDKGGAIVVYNTRTQQRVTIEQDKMPLTPVIVAATNYVLSPAIAHIEGACEFYANVNDTVEIAFIGCTQGWGFLNINFANFHLKPWRSSMFSNMAQVNP